MKRLLVLALLVLAVAGLFATSTYKERPVVKGDRANAVIHYPKIWPANSRVLQRTEDWDFINDPLTDEPLRTVMTNNYYDYMIGSYCSFPIRVMPDGSIYMIFHGVNGIENTTTGPKRTIWWSYVDNQGSLVSPATEVYADNTRKGYPGMDIDPETGNAFTFWHENTDADAELEDRGGCDNYAFSNAPGNYIPSNGIVAIDNPVSTTYNGETEADAEYNWPNVNIGVSPIEGKKRLYVTATNATYMPHNSSSASEDVYIAYTDYSQADIDNDFANVTWQYSHVEPMLKWHFNSYFMRMFQGLTVTDEGKLVIMGFVSVDSTHQFDNGSGNPAGFNHLNNIVALQSDNYGQTFQVYQTEGVHQIDISTWPSTVLTYFDLDPATDKVWYEPSTFSTHINVVEAQNGYVHCPMAYDWNYKTDNSYFFPNSTFIKDVRFNTNDHSFRVSDLYPQGLYPNDNIPYNGWDEDADNVPDSTWAVEGGTAVKMINSFPIFWWTYEDSNSFHLNGLKMSSNKEKGWMVTVWQDGLKPRYATDTNLLNPDYSAYASAPDIYIAASNSNGSTWSQPIRLNAVDIPELNGTIPEFVYVADKIVPMSSDPYEQWGKVHLMFFDDNSYGSFIQSAGTNLGGNVVYTCLKIKFPPVANDDNQNVEHPMVLNQNYPNPFNPETTISFTAKAAGNATLKIYNVRGQVVKTLVNGHVEAGVNNVVWRGESDNGTRVSSGVYFYELNNGNHKETKKMILMK